MGPPLFSGGNARHGDPIEVPEGQAFNGAAAVQRRKYALPAIGIANRGVPSMGPPLFSGGNKSEDDADRQGNTLQWGRRCSAAEMRYSIL